MRRSAALLASILLLACSGQVHEASIVLALEYPRPDEAAIEYYPGPLDTPNALASRNFGFVKRYVEELSLDRMIDELDLRSEVPVQELESSISVEVRDELSILRVIPSSRFSAEEVADYLIQSATTAFIDKSIYALKRRQSFWLGEGARACLREGDQDSHRESLPRCARACEGLAQLCIDQVITRRQLGDTLSVFDEPSREPVPALGLTSDTVHATLVLRRGIRSCACEGVRLDSANLLYHLSKQLKASRSQLSTVIDKAGLYPDEAASLERKAVIDMMRDAIVLTELAGATESERRFRLAFAYETPEGAQRGVRALALALVEAHEKAAEACVERARALAAGIDERHCRVELDEASRRSVWEKCEPWILEDIDQLRQSAEKMARSRARLRTVGDVELAGVVD